MKRYDLPTGMRYSTLKERKDFYMAEFDMEHVGGWLRDVMEKPIFAVIIGRHTRICRRKYREDASATILIDEYRDLSDVKDQILEFLPESVYYDRNVYDEKGNVVGQEMAFDLDPENMTCPVHGSLEQKMKRGQGLSFCKLELNMVRDEALRLYEEIKTTFSRVRIVYSGRGFHIHVLDKDAFGWSYDERRKLSQDLKANGFLIDEWVTSGGMRLMRLPYSLHGLVSRIVTPLDIERLGEFEPTTDQRCIPNFLKSSF